MKIFFISIVVIYFHFLIIWSVYQDIKEKYVEAKNDFEDSITGQVILFKEGKVNGVVRYNKKPNEVANYNSNIKIQG